MAISRPLANIPIHVCEAMTAQAMHWDSHARHSDTGPWTSCNLLSRLVPADNPQSERTEADMEINPGMLAPGLKPVPFLNPRCEGNTRAVVRGFLLISKAAPFNGRRVIAPFHRRPLSAPVSPWYRPSLPGPHVADKTNEQETTARRCPMAAVSLHGEISRLSFNRE